VGVSGTTAGLGLRLKMGEESDIASCILKHYNEQVKQSQRWQWQQEKKQERQQHVAAVAAAVVAPAAAAVSQRQYLGVAWVSWVQAQKTANYHAIKTQTPCQYSNYEKG
jgi:hypothetical protein